LSATSRSAAATGGHRQAVAVERTLMIRRSGR
jgi:hypothetical protein